jgi:cytohesin
MQASIEGDVESVEMLLKKGANPNYRDKDGWTPLHAAAQEGNADVAELLIKHGADVNARDIHGWTPLSVAAMDGQVDVVKLLLESCADPTVRGNDGDSPLDGARKWGQGEAARVIEEFIASRLAVLGVEAPELYAGEWGKMIVRARELGEARISIEGTWSSRRPSPWSCVARKV